MCIFKLILINIINRRYAGLFTKTKEARTCFAQTQKDGFDFHS